MHDPTEGGLATGLWELAWAAGKAIECEVVRHGRDKKVIVFKKKRRKKYRRTRGHRQHFTEILIKALPQ